MPKFSGKDILRGIIDDVDPELHAKAGQYADLLVYKEDPVAYAEKILGFKMWEKQQEMAMAITKHRVVRVNAGHGVGKTSSAATLVNWFLDVHDPVLVLTTAPTWNQVRTLLWKEIRAFRRNKGLPGQIKQTEISISDDRFAIGLSTDDETKFQGHHSPNILVVIDEGPGVDPKIFGAVESIRVGQNNRLLSLGNPITQHDPHELLAKKRDSYAMRISCLEHPNVVHNEEIIPGGVTWDWVDEHIAEWCEPVEPPESEEEQLRLVDKGYFWWNGVYYKASPIAMSKILGLPPPVAEDQIISLEDIQGAHNRYMETQKPKKNLVVQLGADVARFGVDENVVYENWAGYVTHPHTWSGLSTVDTANKIWKIATDIRAQAKGDGFNARVRLLIDEGGVGGGVVDYLKDHILAQESAPWFELVPVQFGGAPYNGIRFANKRAEMYYAIKETIKQVAIAPDDRLDRELLEHKYRIDNSGRILIESKDSIKKRLGRSPDRADALVMAIYRGDVGRGDWAPGLDTLIQALHAIYKGGGD